LLGIVLEAGALELIMTDTSLTLMVYEIAHFECNSATVCILIHWQLSAPIWKSSPNNFYTYDQNHFSPSLLDVI